MYSHFSNGKFSNISTILYKFRSISYNRQQKKLSVCGKVDAGMVDYEKMGKRIKYKRQGKNMNQEEIARQVQISPSYYGNIERGNRVPSVDTLVAIANVLEVGTDFLLADSLTIANRQRTEQETRVLTRFLRDRVEELIYDDALTADDAPPEL